MPLKIITIKHINFYIFILLGLSNFVYSQEKQFDTNQVKDIENYGSFRYIMIKTHAGKHFYTGKTLDEELKYGYQSIEVRYGWQNSNPEHWANKYYNGANYGIGFYSAYIGTPGIMGTPIAAFGFINFPQGKLSSKTTIITDGALGVTYNSNHYNAETNPKNDAIGGPFSVYVNIGLGFETIVSRNMDIIYGIDYTHFSNGRLTLPNYGLNMLGLNLGMKYHYNKDQKNTNSDIYTTQILQSRFHKTKSKPTPKNLKNRLNILAAFGSVQNESSETNTKETETNSFTTFSSYLEYQFNLNIKHGIDTGIDVFYDGSLEPEYPKEKDRYLYAYHLGYNYTFGKMLLKIDFGGYMGPNGEKGKDNLWARAALQYKIIEHLSLHLGLKTKQGFTADWAEFGIVVHPFK